MAGSSRALTVHHVLKVFEGLMIDFETPAVGFTAYGEFRPVQIASRISVEADYAT
jgi:hypothetical protein